MFSRHRIDDALRVWKGCWMAVVASLTLNAGLTSANADLITYEFTATVDDAATVDGAPISIGPGTSVSGFSTFESTAQDTNTDTSHGKYLDAVTDWEFSLTGATFSGDEGQINVGDNVFNSRDFF